MPNRTIEKGFVISPGIAAVLLAAILGILGWAYKSSTADNRETRDAIIEMKTMLNERTRVFDQQQARMEDRLQSENKVAELQREQMNEKLRNMKATLEQRGFRVNQ